MNKNLVDLIIMFYEINPIPSTKLLLRHLFRFSIDLILVRELARYTLNAVYRNPRFWSKPKEI